LEIDIEPVRLLEAIFGYAIVMKIRESGMPDECTWAGFFKPCEILNEMELDDTTTNVAEFGCGYGTFTMPAAKIVRGKVYSIDIEPELVKGVRKRAEQKSLDNVIVETRDFVSEGSGLQNESVDYAMLFNILHAEDPIGLFKEAYRILRPGGKIGVVHWNYDSTTPRGPPMEIRPRPWQCIEWGISLGFELIKRCDLKPYHYGLVFSKPRK